jgi:radical SAM superfamily enzyme YgiQ (UPF0313 family)
MPDLLLATLNARYIHASLGLRCLLANLGELRPRAELREYTIQRPAIEIVEDLLQRRPRIVGLGVYIWNVVETTRVVALLKTLAPEVIVVLGGPEVSHETDAQEVVRRADYVITGPGEVSFRRLCAQLLADAGQEGISPCPSRRASSPILPGSRLHGSGAVVIAGESAPLSALEMPYREYLDTDIAHRVLYVEAARGCPFKCEFCLSALDKSSKPFELERFLDEMARLHARGARHFKFVDRTFNLNVKTGVRILEFFLERLDARLFLHFEVIPDHFPEALKAPVARFPPGSLQFEVGVQTFNPVTQALIARRQDDARTEANLRWLRQHSHAHLHADLIVGLPGEDMASFGRGFDRLLALGPHEIQVGLLKRLRGAPIARHDSAFGMRYSPMPPYDILANDLIDFASMRRLARFARYWDVFANSGRFPHALPLLLGETPFVRFLAFSDWLHARLGQTDALTLEARFEVLHAGLTTVFQVDVETVRQALAADHARSGSGGLPRYLRQTAVLRESGENRAARRQARHRPG